MTFLAVTVGAFHETCTVTTDVSAPHGSGADELVGAAAPTWRRPSRHFGLEYVWADSATEKPLLRSETTDVNLYVDGRVIVAVAGDPQTGLCFRQATYDRGLIDFDETLHLARESLHEIVAGTRPACLVIAGFSRQRGRAEAYQFFAPSYEAVRLGEGHHIFPRPLEDGFNAMSFRTQWLEKELTAMRPRRASAFHRECFDRMLIAWRAKRCTRSTGFSDHVDSAEVSVRGAFMIPGPKKPRLVSRFLSASGRLRRALSKRP